MTWCWFGIAPFQGGNDPAIFLTIIGKSQLHCPGIGKNANDWGLASVSILFVASTAA